MTGHALAVLLAFLTVSGVSGMAHADSVEDLAAAAARTVPWSSDPEDDTDWVRNDDGTYDVFPATDDA